jgi:hypothetical protein
MKEIVCDVAVIGGGAAGMMAAGVAADKLSERTGRDKATVVLIEKNRGLGEKLLITGGGRCNVTNANPDEKSLLSKFKDARKYLHSAFARHSVEDSLKFFHSKGVRTKVEAEYRVFPVTDRAKTIWDALVGYLATQKVEVVSNSPVARILATDGRIERITMLNGTHVRAQTYILATGGLSHPETGSTGDGFTWLSELGHTVRTEGAALVPISLRDSWTKQLAGVALTDARVTVFQNGAKQAFQQGKMLFTHVGVSGPAILNLSSEIGELLKYGDVKLEIDFFPALSEEKVGNLMLDLVGRFPNKVIRNALPEIVPSAVAGVLLELVKIAPDTACHSLPRESRIALARLLKHMPATVKGLLGLTKAVVASGGVSLKEVDFRTMRSNKIANLYIVGDLLDVYRPSGGYSLQLCWTTAAIAGESAAAAIK